jgi:hypothetical protein
MAFGFLFLCDKAFEETLRLEVSIAELNNVAIPIEKRKGDERFRV